MWFKLEEREREWKRGMRRGGGGGGIMLMEKSFQLHTQSGTTNSHLLYLSLIKPHNNIVVGRVLLNTPSPNPPTFSSLLCCSFSRRDFHRYSHPKSSSSSSSNHNMPNGVVEEILDTIFIFKVFRFYGWWLTPVLISMLLATGLKAFLLALAVPVGLSLVALPFNKLWGTINDSKLGSRAYEKKPRNRSTSNIDIEEEWSPNDDGIDEGVKDSSIFKGWDDLDKGKELDERRMRRDKKRGRSRKEGRFVRKERGVEIPLLLRLLIAVFPFLGSWTKMM